MVEVENSVKLVDPHRDALYNYDASAHRTLTDTQRPWKKDPHYFSSIRISAVALLKMVIHAREGADMEVMGLMQGYVAAHTFVVTDAYRLPVEGTETRVNAQDEANEYMVEYLQSCRDAGRMENAIGWYHSHPGYGCWLSGIDVSTQETQQMFNDPFVAVVIDPDRTVSAGKVEIGAFRTFPQDYKPPESNNTSSNTGGSAGADGNIPLNKADDFGAHAARYYAVDVSHFKSTLDARILSLLWNKYWAATIGQSPLFTNRDYGSRQMGDLSQKIGRAARATDPGPGPGGPMGVGFGVVGGGPGVGGGHGADGKDESLEKIVREGRRVVGAEMTGLMAAEIKKGLFQGVGANAK